jgi:glutamine kinase
MKFLSKGKNLSNLKSLNLQKSKIPKFYNFSIDEILKNKKKIIDLVFNELKKKISIRSSYFLEDNYFSSMAGEFDGLYNIQNTKYNILKGISYLAEQYKKKNSSKKIYLQSEIIFQNHLTSSIMSGVLTNKCIKDGTDYYVINYDDTSNLTNTVTSGGKNGGRVINIFKRNNDGLRSKKFKKIIDAVVEIESKVGNKPIDIEFALDDKNNVNIFQIRPISTFNNWKKIDNYSFLTNLKNNQKKLINIYKKNKYFGDHMVFGLMPDWNPVEMIGYHPSNLSYSLYAKLITNKSWNIARHLIGYKKVNRPLMYKFTQKPFIDARLSFFSFLPKNLNNKTSKKIVNFWCKQLYNKPYLHDKIEFEIADGSYDALSKNKITTQYNFLTSKEKKDYLLHLKKFTENIINNYQNNFDTLNKKLISLENYRFKLITLFKKNSKFNFNKEIKRLIDEIIINGIVPFSIYARYAFIGKKYLISLRKKKILSQKTYQNLINSAEIITKEYISLEKKLNKNYKYRYQFDNYFYHLRPGTYDIKIKRYNSLIRPRKLENINHILKFQTNKVNINDKELSGISNFLKRDKINSNADDLLNFSITSIKLRENSKFIFTRAVSDLLELIKKNGKRYKLNNAKLSKLSIDQILKLDINKKFLVENKQDNLDLDLDFKSKLPYLITDINDFFIVSNLLTKPNFITNQIVSGQSEEIDINEKNESLKNKIILIENADPGFDWVFSKNIKGLVTKYGGVNSHMSIRCEELNLPAVVGLGEENYEKIKNCLKINLNCKNEHVFGM